MPRSDLLDDIESGALDPGSDLPTLLRKCITLGGRTDTSELRDWASRELKGYEAHNDLPSYRQVPAPLLLDGMTGRAIIRGQVVDASLLPDEAQDLIRDPMPTPQPISEVVELIDAAGRGDGSVRLAPAGSPYLITLMNHSLRGQSHVERVYWGVETSKLRGITDNVRTILVELVAEMRAAMPPGADVPPPEVAQQAVQVVIHGGKRQRVTVNQTAAGGDAAGSSAGSNATISSEPEPESAQRTFMWWLAGIGTIVAAVAGVWALFIR